MATSKFYLDKRAARKDGKLPLKVSISHKGKTALISLGVFLLPGQWDEKAGKITGGANKALLNAFVTKRKLDIDAELLKLATSGNAGAMGVTAIREYILSRMNPLQESKAAGSFVKAFRKFIGQKTKQRTKEIYEITLRRLYGFCPEFEKLNLEDVTKDWLISFDKFLSATSPSRNARNIHLRNIRAVFNAAIDDEVTVAYPFRKFKIKNEATAKRSLTVGQLRLLFSCDVEPHQEKYRDMFMLIFLLMGINTVDLLRLKASNFNGERIEYRRAKTGRLYDIKVEPEAAALLEKYKGKKHLLNALDSYDNYRDYAKRLNSNLKQIGKVNIGKHGKKTRVPLFPKISTYWARHSWATIAASLDIPKETIAAGLGHGGNTVTDIYIDFDRRKVDEANRRIIDWVMYGKK